MKTIGLAVALAMLLTSFSLLHAAVPDYLPGEYIYDGLNPLEVDGYPVIAIADWNNDNKKDLVIGQYTNGYIWLFLNVGTDAAPVFNGGSLIESNGAPITVPSG